MGESINGQLGYQFNRVIDLSGMVVLPLYLENGSFWSKDTMTFIAQLGGPQFTLDAFHLSLA